MTNSGQTPDPPVANPQAALPGAEIIQQGIENLKAHNEQANSELTDILARMRSQLGAFFTALPQLQPQGQPDDLQVRRIVLQSSQWASEVIMAAALKEEFKEQVGGLARAILVDAGMYPTVPQPIDDVDADV